MLVSENVWDMATASCMPVLTETESKTKETVLGPRRLEVKERSED